MVANLAARRDAFERVVAAARAEATDLGHDLHPATIFEGNPWHVRAYCRRCGSRVEVRLLPDGDVDTAGLVDRCGAAA